jgi:hypothetical protein
MNVLRSAVVVRFEGVANLGKAIHITISSIQYRTVHRAVDPPLGPALTKIRGANDNSKTVYGDMMESR